MCAHMRIQYNFSKSDRWPLINGRDSNRKLVTCSSLSKAFPMSILHVGLTNYTNKNIASRTYHGGHAADVHFSYSKRVRSAGRLKGNLKRLTVRAIWNSNRSLVCNTADCYCFLWCYSYYSRSFSQSSTVKCHHSTECVTWSYLLVIGPRKL